MKYPCIIYAPTSMKLRSYSLRPKKTDNSRKNKSHGYYICFWE